MTWTHNIIGSENYSDQLRVLIDYTDGDTVFHDSVSIASSSATLEWLKCQITRKLTQLNAVNSFDVPTGEIDLTPAAVPTPVNKTSSSQSSIAAGGSVDTTYVVTTGKVLTVTIFTGGGAATEATLAHSNGQKVELFYDPNGNGTGMTLIDVIYCNGSSSKFIESFSTDSGNGTRSVRLRRTNFSSVASESFCKWNGSEI